jgi:hypothetical protein
MPTFRIQQKVSSWQEVKVTADTLAEALEIATDEILAGNGHADPDSFDLEEEYYAENQSTGEEGLIVFDDEYEPQIDK